MITSLLTTSKQVYSVAHVLVSFAYQLHQAYQPAENPRKNMVRLSKDSTNLLKPLRLKPRISDRKQLLGIDCEMMKLLKNIRLI